MDIGSNDAWNRILEIFPDMDFTEELKANPELQKYIKDAINKNAVDLECPLDTKEAPKLDTDYSKYIIMTGLPVCDEAKSLKFNKLLIKLFQKQKYDFVTEDLIEHSWNIVDGVKKTTGQAFILMPTDEKAKIAAALFNGHKLDKNHIFSACTFPDYMKIMGTGEEEEKNNSEATSFLELKNYMLTPIQDQYAYQQNKNVVVNKLFGQSKVLHMMPDDDRLALEQKFNSDQPFLWSPKGTYMILIKSDKVEFVGGSSMQPVLTIPKPKVDTVVFSPCERYVLIYLPKNDNPYEIWNFVTKEFMRDFEQDNNEDAKTFKWSHDGNFIAKIEKKTKMVGEEEVEKTYIRIYEIKDKEVVSTEDSDGNKTPIPVNGLQKFLWMPNRNVLVYSSFPSDENAKPRITFQEMPTRRVLNIHPMNECLEMTMYYHPQGQYLAVVNRYLDKKTEKYSVEVFETKEGTNMSQIPHQQIMVNRDVRTFHAAIWEPNHNKLAIHTLSKKVLEAGQKQFSNIDHQDVIDLYQLKNDKLLGFRANKLATLPQDKIKEFHFSGSGNIFATIEQDGLAKMSCYFYMMSKQSVELQEADKLGGGGMRKQTVGSENNDVYEIRKTGRYELKEKRNFEANWDHAGRYFVVQGIKRTSIDQEGKSIRIFNMFGELLDAFDDLKGLSRVHFRPRARDIVNTKKLQALKKTYKDKYQQMYKDEESHTKKERNDMERDKRKEVRDDFLNNFFIPARTKYEENMEQYKAIFPIKEKDFAEEEISYHSIYQHKDVLNSRKLDLQ